MQEMIPFAAPGNPARATSRRDAWSLRSQDFTWLCELVRRMSGLNLHRGKQALVRARLAKRARQLGLGGVDDYLERLRDDPGPEELAALFDALSTNQTRFFRDAQNFGDLVDLVVPTTSGRRLRIWSAGCASGEEPYSIAMTLLERVPDLSSWDAKVLGTDLSRRCIRRARQGIYGAEQVEGLSDTLRRRYFSPHEAAPASYRLNGGVRAYVDLARLNLVEPWPMRGPFDAIFCRNVMIYFERATQTELVDRFFRMLRPRGVLFIGPAESLTNRASGFRYVRPTVYLKP